MRFIGLGWSFRRLGAGDDAHRAFLEGGIGEDLVQTDDQSVQDALLLLQLTFGITERNESAGGVFADFGGQQVDLFLKEIHAGFGHLGIDGHGIAQAGDKLGDLLLLGLHLRLK